MCDCALSRRQLLRLGGAAAAAPLLAGCDRLPLVPESAVRAMGLQAWEELRREIPPSEDRDLQAALDAVARELLLAAGQTPSDWEVLVFASPQVNAFALPGNKIGVFEGMFPVFGSPDQLAAVVGHEIGHLGAEHSRERMTAELTRDLGLRILTLVLGLAEVEFAADIAAALGLGIQYGLVLPYSRRQELEADRFGVTLMAEAGFDPAEAAELWRRMDAQGGQRVPAFLATHPDPEARIEAIEAMLPELAAG